MVSSKDGRFEFRHSNYHNMFLPQLNVFENAVGESAGDVLYYLVNEVSVYDPTDLPGAHLDFLAGRSLCQAHKISSNH